MSENVKILTGTKVEEDADEDLLELETNKDTKPKSAKVKNDISLSCFLEDKDGKPIPPGQKKALFEMVRSYWQFIFDNGKAPLTSGLATINTKPEFRLLMESNFECVHYCDSHWKVGRLWTGYYPTWLKGALAQRAAEETWLKAEEVKKAAEATVIVVDDDEGSGGDNSGKGAGKDRTGKHGRPDNDMGNRPKQPRIEEVQPARPVPTKVTTNHARVCTLIYVGYMHH